MSAPDAAIRVEGVTRRFDGKAAVSEVTLEVSEGCCLALIGPSGCGKSTLLRLVMGLIRPDAGSVRIGEIAVGPATTRELRMRVGYVIQEGGLFPHLTAAGNVTLKARDLGWSADRTRGRLEELADLVHLPPAMLERYPAQLSGGQRQRVGLMRALMLDPAALLMDEPLGALDPMVRSRLQEELREIFMRLRKTVLLVTHDMGEAAYLGDRIALMREGRVVQEGSVDDLMERPRDPFVPEFIGAQRPLWIGGDGARR